MEYKLQFELVPDGCWYANLRSFLTPSQWDVVRKEAYARAQGRCQICSLPTARLEAHERWAYNEEKGIQKLVDVIAVCRRCHEVIHIGRTQLMGRETEASEWFMKVNNCSYADYRAALGEANQLHRRRNRVGEWITDVSWLQDNVKDKKLFQITKR
ncbi:MAG: HNH endonuclease [Clostridia bacterium]|nr:HNH endonuclease [Clostridia bacterium]